MKAFIVSGTNALCAEIADDGRAAHLAELSKFAPLVWNSSAGRLPQRNSKKNDGSTAHSHDLSRMTNKFCQNRPKTRSGDIQIQTLRTTCAGHEHLARALPIVQA